MIVLIGFGIKKKTKERQMSEADKLLKKWFKHHCEGGADYDYDTYDDKCWYNLNGRAYSKEYTNLIKDTIKYIENKGETDE